MQNPYFPLYTIKQKRFEVDLRLLRDSYLVDSSSPFFYPSPSPLGG
jgi:hypothetical protein